MRALLLSVAVLLGAASAAAAQDGKAIFMKKGNCATCHGPMAQGTPLAPNLTDSTWLNVDGTIEQITALIKSGVPKPKKHPAPMPPMGGAKLSDAEIAAVAKYVLSLPQTKVSDAGGGHGCMMHARRHAAARTPPEAI